MRTIKSLGNIDDPAGEWIFKKSPKIQKMILIISN